MSISPSSPFKLPLRQSVLHDRVERLGLAVGAARERTVRAGLTSVPGEHSAISAIGTRERRRSFRFFSFAHFPTSRVGECFGSAPISSVTTPWPSR